jgi:hypothetical protein
LRYACAGTGRSFSEKEDKTMSTRKITIEEARQDCDRTCKFCQEELEKAEEKGFLYVYLDSTWHVHATKEDIPDWEK